MSDLIGLEEMRKCVIFQKLCKYWPKTVQKFQKHKIGEILAAIRISASIVNFEILFQKNWALYQKT